MEIETRQTENGSEIVVESEKKVAIIVEDQEEERIYLPEPGGSDSTYYAGSAEGVSENGEKYSVFHEGEISDLKVFSK